MGNTTQCGLFANESRQYLYLGEQNHFLYGQISHFHLQKAQNEHFAIKKIRFQSEKDLQKFKQKFYNYQEICQILPLTKICQYRSLKNSSNQTKQKQQEAVSKQNESLFQCNKHSFLFKSPLQQFHQDDRNYNCSGTSFVVALKLQYIQSSSSLSSILYQKKLSLQNLLQKSKVNQNTLLQLENKVKLCDYQKIDKLPPKQRQLINIWFSEIQILRIMDLFISAIYGLKIYGLNVDSVRPECLFKTQHNQKFKLFFPQIINKPNQGNLGYSLQKLKKWIDQQNAIFHHNWNASKQRQLISYIHPCHLDLLNNFLNKYRASKNYQYVQNVLSKEQIEKQNIFSLGLVILQLCILQPFICSKIYQISTFKYVDKQVSKNNSKIQRKDKSLLKSKQLIQEIQDITFKFNENLVKKYLSQMMQKYSSKFVGMIQKMILGDFEHSKKVDSKLSNAPKTEIQRFNNYEEVIEQLTDLIQQNSQNLKIVYDPTRKQKSVTKNVSDKNSRSSSLSRQVSVSGITNPSLSSNSSISVFPIQSQQRIYSLQLLKKHCKHFQKKSNRMQSKIQLNHLTQHNTQFKKKQKSLQNLLVKDEQRILSQLNKLNEQKNVSLLNNSLNFDNNIIKHKQTRFNYRKMNNQMSQINNKNKSRELTEKDMNKHSTSEIQNSFNGQISIKESKLINQLRQQDQMMKKRVQLNNKRNESKQMPHLTRQNMESKQKQRRMNSTTKVKKLKIQRAKQEEAMGASQCRAIPIYLTKNRKSSQELNQRALNQSKEISNQITLSIAPNSFTTIIRKLDDESNWKDPSKNEKQKNPQVKPFYQGLTSQNFNSKSELKNLIQSKKRGVPSKLELQSSVSPALNKIKQLKSQQLYQIYLKQYKSMIYQNQQTSQK